MNRPPLLQRPARRGGFTLVELMISVTLVVLMMMMFAQIFQMAAGAISTQKGIAENDQRVRSLTTILQEDLSARTFQRLIPFQPDEQDQNGNGIPDGTEDRNLNGQLDKYSIVGDDQFEQERRGYFHYAENDPADQTDDVLQFTIKVTGENGVTLPLLGKATLLKAPDDSVTTKVQREALLQLTMSGQPEFDDKMVNVDQTGSLSHINGTGASTYAEVSYFLRNGVLYRRVLLIRPNTGVESYKYPSDPPLDPPHFIFQNGQNYGPANVPIIPDASGWVWHDAIGTFWHDFDYSAYYDTANGRPWFHDLRSLSNDPNNSRIVNGYPVSLGIPYLRYGNSLNSTAGRPRQYLKEFEIVSSGSPDPTGYYVGSGYFGRFTLQETANPSFGYPGVISKATPDPHSSAKALSFDAKNLLAPYNTSTLRRGEDVLMGNVHEFDVKVWAVNFGANGVPGNPGDDDSHAYYLDSTTGTNISAQDGVTNPANGSMVWDLHEAGWPGSDDRWGFFDLGYGRLGSAQGVFARPEVNTVTTAMSSTFGNKFDTWHPSPLLANPPYRPVSYGQDGAPGLVGVDDDGNGLIDDLNEVGWPGTDDESPLMVGGQYKPAFTAIQIRIRFLDPTSGQMRQLTLVENLEASASGGQ